ncbi:L-proline dehydrogenase [Salsuginibacillus halophilus]|uniref:proline dehydrogenase n=1 Tax=Salsuginibacillus halophilus TaxID=517424 RepID=A0A2P8HFW9_9BACI|nr:proline dehydrogenase [Salsuginibacillus halophilus]PSL45090.1 L-proline dehydrogenase [Salsuginibacillus halophilus]
MKNLSRNFFLHLSENKLLNRSAKKWGLKLGASKVVAGTTIEAAIPAISQLNHEGLKVTLDHLGEFVTERNEAEEAARACVHTLQTIQSAGVDSQVSVKLTKLGLDIDENLCMENMHHIMQAAAANGNFINIDMEDYSRYDTTLNIVEELRRTYDNVGTVLQSYLYRGLEDLDRFKGVPLRLVKGAYKESPEVAMQDKEAIDANFLRMIQKHLLNGSYTAIATHDHQIIAQIKTFVHENDIPYDRFEFQMLYGFRADMQKQLAEEGYTFRTYVPFGNDWYGYFMRRLAERPQNVAFAVRGLVSK